jgi:hypothetical protein
MSKEGDAARATAAAEEANTWAKTTTILDRGAQS